MRYIKSCGFVVYKELNGKRLYLIIRTSNGEYGFPKGHVEENETALELLSFDDTKGVLKEADGYISSIACE